MCHVSLHTYKCISRKFSCGVTLEYYHGENSGADASTVFVDTTRLLSTCSSTTICASLWLTAQLPTSHSLGSVTLLFDWGSAKHIQEQTNPHCRRANTSVWAKFPTNIQFKYLLYFNPDTYSSPPNNYYCIRLQVRADLSLKSDRWWFKMYFTKLPGGQLPTTQIVWRRSYKTCSSLSLVVMSLLWLDLMTQNITTYGRNAEVFGSSLVLCFTR